MGSRAFDAGGFVSGAASVVRGEVVVGSAGVVGSDPGTVDGVVGSDAGTVDGVDGVVCAVGSVELVPSSADADVTTANTVSRQLTPTEAITRRIIMSDQPQLESFTRTPPGSRR